MPFSLDGIPIVGELGEAGYPGFWLATGFGPHGMMEGPAAGRLVGEAVVTQQQGAGGTPPSPAHRRIQDAVKAGLAAATPMRFFRPNINSE